jgi:hypothetical protein
MFWGEETYASGSAPVPLDHKNWIMVSPEMHGSWPDPPDPENPGAYAYISLEAQADIMAAVSYALANYNIDPSRIYLTGYSMGGQGAVVMAAKYPHLFAAMFDNKGPTDMYDWYDDNSTSHQDWMERECHIGGEPKEPAQNPFCYQRRSGLSYAGNLLHIPISITHAITDVLVPITQSYRLRDKVNSLGPDYPLAVYGEPNPVDENNDPCPPAWHCYDPPPMNVLNFLEPFTLNNSPEHINITTDQSKAFYWLNISQTGGDHWSQVEVWVDEANNTVSATVSDTNSLTLGFNLGSTPMTDTIAQPGMGLPATTYLVNGGGVYNLVDYASGYLNTFVSSGTSPYPLTISAIDVSITANPATVSGGQSTALTVTAQDQLGNPAPDGTLVQLSTTAGVFPNGNNTYSASTTGGQAVVNLTVPQSGSDAQVTAAVGAVSDMTTVTILSNAIYLSIILSSTSVSSGETITYTYTVTNTGQDTLTDISLIDDNGTPGAGGDDYACNQGSLAAGASFSCQRNATILETITNTISVTGLDFF